MIGASLAKVTALAVRSSKAWDSMPAVQPAFSPGGALIQRKAIRLSWRLRLSPRRAAGGRAFGDYSAGVFG